MRKSLSGVQERIFLHTRQEYPSVLPGPTILISPMLSHPGPDKKSRVCNALVV